MSFPRPLRRSVSLSPARTLRLVVLGQSAVGKTALTVRFITRRFIGDYDPTLEMIYRHVAVIDGEMVHFEILDTAGQEEDSLQIEEKIKWGDGFAVVYSVTDRCSFDEVMRLCFLINHLHSSPKRSGGAEQPPVVIVANKKDLQFDRMVSTEDGENLSKALKLPFYEISTRDSYEEPVAVFSSLYQELLRQGHFSPGSFKRRTVSKLMEKIPKMQASSTLNSVGRSLSFNSFRDYIPEPLGSLSSSETVNKPWKKGSRCSIPAESTTCSLLSKVSCLTSPPGWGSPSLRQANRTAQISEAH
ncbi:ras-related and estrogen-regulated growth inhibitor-like [Empidonax traillii]|uniref:ras-related and estrogen-regulated growth inhibitor-like n=1 Tax=Empidonax traillii TaxID=164674 RepID=UPI000FFD94EF|nr:ras-related and estrogen-regulated growth inhibitor-like [Empidonax traillii]